MTNNPCEIWSVQYKLNAMNREGKKEATLSEIEREIIDVFIRLADVLSLQRSVGELYGLLFISEEPLCFNECQQKLGISKGSVSQGLKFLRSFGAVKAEHVSGDRKDYYVAETRLRKMVTGFASEQIQPHVKNGRDRLNRLNELVEQAPEERREFLLEKINHLENWHKRADRVLPMAIKLIQ